MKIPIKAPRRWRRVAWVLALSLILPVVGVLVMPWALGSRTGRVWLLGRANRALAPGRLDLATLEFSWFGPTKMSGFVLRGGKGEGMVAAPKARWDRNLRQILFDKQNLGTLVLNRSDISIERREDGSLNLYETLKPLLGRDPRTSLKIDVRDGRFRLHGAGFAQEVTAENAAIMLEIKPMPGPMTGKIRLANGAKGKARSSLDLEGTFLRGRDDFELKILGTDWPVALGGENVKVLGEFEGMIEAARKDGRWESKGKVTLGGVLASGARLSGDSLRQEAIEGTWDFSGTEGEWTVMRAELTSSAAKMKAKGTFKPSDPLAGKIEIEGNVDLAAIVGQIPHVLRLRHGVVLERGRAEVRGTTARGDGSPALELTAKVSDLVARNGKRGFTLKDPATLAARVGRPKDVYVLEGLSAETPYLKGEGRGDLSRGLTYKATIDLAGFQEAFRELIDFGSVAMAGNGNVSGSYRAEGGRFQGNMMGEVKGLRIEGVGPSAMGREKVELVVDLEGASSQSGLPESWSEATGRLASEGLRAELKTESGSRHASLIVSGPLELPDLKALGEGRIEASWNDQVVTLSPIELSMSPAEKGTGPAPIRVGARARLDRKKGELTIERISDGKKPGVVELDGEGLKISGLGGKGDLRVEGGLTGDLALLAPWIRSGPKGLRGRWMARGSGRTEEDGLNLSARVDVQGLAWGAARVQEWLPGEEAGEAIGLGIRALLPKKGDALEVSEVSLRSRYATLEGAGRVEDLRGKRILALKGIFAPEWNVLSAKLAEKVEPGASVSGRPRAFTVQAPMGADWRKGLNGEVGVSLDGADLYGLKLGATEMVIRSTAGVIGIDPIEATLNEGTIHLEPEIKLGGGEGKASALVLGPGSSLREVKVNDEVSRRVLSFVAPVLDNATRVRGSVSAEIEEAVFPLSGDVAKGTKVRGSVVFQDVAFAPGPLTEQLFAMVGRDQGALWKLNEPVSLSIRDRRIYQSGLTIPIGRLSRVEIEGWVDFDRKMDLTASIPVLPSMLADRPLLAGIAGDAKIRVPIRGTLDEPKVDQEAFELGMKDLGRSILTQSLGAGAAELIGRMTQPRDPNLPPPAPRITPEERKLKRLEKRAERRRSRGAPP